MSVLYTNNAKTNIIGSINELSTSFDITSGSGELFPLPNGDDYFYATLVDATNTTTEIIRINTRIDDTFSDIDRGVDGTTALEWDGDRIELRITRILLDELYDGKELTLDTLYINDNNTYIDVSGSNLQFTDDGCGTHTLEDLSETQTINSIAGETLSSNRAVMITNGKVYYFDTTNDNHYGKCVGITKHSSSINDDIRIITSGKLNTGVGLTNNTTYYVSGTTGILTNVVPTTGLLQIIGNAIDNTNLHINIQTTIKIN